MGLIEKEIVTEIALQLEKPVTYVYKVLVNAQVTLGIMELLSIPLFFIISAIGIKLFWNATNKMDDYSDRGAARAVGIMCIVVFSALITWTIISGMATILLPEYSAIMKIARMIGGGI